MKNRWAPLGNLVKADDDPPQRLPRGVWPLASSRRPHLRTASSSYVSIRLRRRRPVGRRAPQPRDHQRSENARDSRPRLVRGARLQAPDAPSRPALRAGNSASPPAGRCTCGGGLVPATGAATGDVTVTCRSAAWGCTQTAPAAQSASAVDWTPLSRVVGRRSELRALPGGGRFGGPCCLAAPAPPVHPLQAHPSCTSTGDVRGSQIEGSDGPTMLPPPPSHHRGASETPRLGAEKGQIA